MTNKESMQAAHLEAINEHPSEIYSSELCTTITAEAIGEAMEWIIKEAFKLNEYTGKYYIIGQVKEYTIEELKQLFLNQKAKI